MQTESDYYLIRNVHSQKCLTLAEPTGDPGTPIVQATCDEAENQQFEVEDVARGGVVRLISRASGLTVEGWENQATSATVEK